MTATLHTGPMEPRPRTHRAADLLHEARAQERAARIADAMASYQAAIAAAEGAGESALLAEGLRRLAVIRHHRNESDEARRLCHTSYTVAHVAGERYENARLDAEAALAVFDQLGVGSAKADAYRVLGMIYRETSRPALAESRLKSAIELAVGAASVLNEAEASRELALLYQTMGRNQEALSLLNTAHRLFGRLDARAHLVHVAGKMAELEATYLAVVREWGQSLESADT